MKRSYLIMIMFLMLVNCKTKNDTICNVEDPLAELSWMQELKEELDNNCGGVGYYVINQATYKGQFVYYTNFICPVCNTVFHIELINCEGEVIKIYNYDQYDDFSSEVSNTVEIYSCLPTI